MTNKEIASYKCGFKKGMQALLELYKSNHMQIIDYPSSFKSDIYTCGYYDGFVYLHQLYLNNFDLIHDALNEDEALSYCLRKRCDKDVC